MSTFWQILLVGCGGALGALTRFGINESVTWWRGEAALNSGLPIATLSANLIGCFLIGLLLGSDVGENYPSARYGLGVGFLGSLTTFSTFSAESIEQIQSGQSLPAMIYIGTSIVLGLLLVFAGMSIAKRLT